MKYSFWKLLRAQYSWKNDKRQILVNTVVVTIWLLINMLFGGIVPIPEATLAGLLGALTITWVVGWIFLNLTYHILKLVIMIAACALVTQAAKRDLTEAHEAYIEMLTWRQ